MAEKLALAQHLERVVPAFTRQVSRNFDFGVLAYFDNPAVSEWQHHSGEIEDLLNRPAAEISLEDDQVSVLNLLGEKNEEALANFRAIDELVSQENDGNHGDMLGILAAVMFPGNDSHRRSLTNIMFVEGWRAKYPEDGLYVPAVDIYPRSRARQQHEVLAEFPLMDKFPAQSDGASLGVHALFGIGTTLLTRGLELMVWLHQKGGNQDLWQAYKDAVKKGEIPVGDVEWTIGDMEWTKPETKAPETGKEIVDDQGQTVEFDQKDKLRLPVKTKEVAVVGYVFTDFKSFQSAIKKAWEKAVLSGKKEFNLFMEFQKVLDDGQKVTMGLYGDDINSLIKAKNVPEFVLERAKNFAQSDTPERALRLFNTAYTVWTDTFIRLGWAQKQEFESVETVWEKLKGEILKEEKAVEPERQEGKQKLPSMPTW